MDPSSKTASHSKLIRDQLWSPVQNASLWMAWWLHGVVSSDEVIGAFHAVQGRNHRLIPRSGQQGFDAPLWTPEQTGLSDVLKAARILTADTPATVESVPLVRLALAGFGDVAPLPHGTAANAVNKQGAAIVLTDPEPTVHHVLVPELVEGTTIYWNWHIADGIAPQLAVFSPGDADAMLREAMKNAETGLRNTGTSFDFLKSHSQTRKDPRLQVGELSDAFGLPGLPVGVATRAARLMARADVVAAIIEVAREAQNDGSLDPYLLPLGRAVRQARMVSVDYAQRELVR